MATPGTVVGSGGRPPVTGALAALADRLDGTVPLEAPVLVGDAARAEVTAMIHGMTAPLIAQGMTRTEACAAVLEQRRTPETGPRL